MAQDRESNPGQLRSELLHLHMVHLLYQPSYPEAQEVSFLAQKKLFQSRFKVDQSPHQHTATTMSQYRDGVLMMQHLFLSNLKI